MSSPADAKAACGYLREAALLIRDDPNRTGMLLSFGNGGQLVVTGDMHGNLRNFEKLQRFCQLDRAPARSVILHELIHQEPERPGVPDTSIDLLIRAAEWKVSFPDNVFFLQSNHELSQFLRYEITKGGRSVLYDFERGVEARFGAAAPMVMEAVNDYLGSLPLAARTASGVFISHSLPDPLRMEYFDTTVLDRAARPEDFISGGPIHSMVWGRFHTPKDVEFFKQRLGVDIFIVGHTPQEMGYAVVGDMLILASDHAHGVFLPIDLSRKYSTEQLEAAIRKFVSVE